MIYASFQSQYGIRLSHDLAGMSWREFAYLINGLSGETPLGRIVTTRAETDPEKIKEFTPEERRIRTEYRARMAKRMQPQKVDDALEQMRQAFIGMAGENETA